MTQEQVPVLIVGAGGAGLSFTQDETGVIALIRDRTTSNTRRVKAAYLIAADGAYSWIREALGISSEGSDAPPA